MSGGGEGPGQDRRSGRSPQAQFLDGFAGDSGGGTTRPPDRSMAGRAVLWRGGHAPSSLVASATGAGSRGPTLGRCPSSTNRRDQARYAIIAFTQQSRKPTQRSSSPSTAGSDALRTTIRDAADVHATDRPAAARRRAGSPRGRDQASASAGWSRPAVPGSGNRRDPVARRCSASARDHGRTA